MFQQFMKDIISKNRILGDMSLILIEKRSTILLGIKIHRKSKALESITITCTIEDITLKKPQIDP